VIRAVAGGGGRPPGSEVPGLRDREPMCRNRRLQPLDPMTNRVCSKLDVRCRGLSERLVSDELQGVSIIEAQFFGALKERVFTMLSFNL
jgi:hypothetical protein